MTQIQVTHNSDFNVSYTDNFGPVQYSDGNHSTVLLTDTITQPGGWLDQAFSGERPWLMVAAPTTPHVETANNEHKYPIPPTPEVKYQDAFPDFKVPRTPDFNPDTVCIPSESWTDLSPEEPRITGRSRSSTRRSSITTTTLLASGFKLS